MKILCVLYDDPKGGMPKRYPLNDLPKLDKYPDGKHSYSKGSATSSSEEAARYRKQ